MQDDILTNEMTREVLAPIGTTAEQTIDFMTKYGVPPQWMFATVVVIVMGKSFGRVMEAVAIRLLAPPGKPRDD